MPCRFAFVPGSRDADHFPHSPHCAAYHRYYPLMQPHAASRVNVAFLNRGHDCDTALKTIEQNDPPE